MGLLLVQAIRRWNDQDPRKPHPERRRLDGIPLDPAACTVLAAIDGRVEPAAAAADILRSGRSDCALPRAIVAWHANRIDLARALLAMPQDPSDDPGIGARNVARILPAPVAAGADGF